MFEWLKGIILLSIIYIVFLSAKKTIWKDGIPPIVSKLRIFIGLAVGLIGMVLLVISGLDDATSGIAPAALIFAVSESLVDKNKGKLWNINLAFLCFNLIGTLGFCFIYFKVIPNFIKIFEGVKMPPLSNFIISTRLWLLTITLLSAIFLVIKETNPNKKICLAINIAYLIISYLMICLVVVSMFLPIFSISELK